MSFASGIPRAKALVLCRAQELEGCRPTDCFFFLEFEADRPRTGSAVSRLEWAVQAGASPFKILGTSSEAMVQVEPGGGTVPAAVYCRLP